MSLKELRHFDIYKPDDMSHYCEIQCRWLHTEKHLLCHRNGKEREITEKELIDDICKCHNGERFRVFYVLKYPKQVESYRKKSLERVKQMYSWEKVTSDYEKLFKRMV